MKQPPAHAPIAIVGRACLLPGVNSPEALWRAVLEGRDLLGPAPVGRWRLSAERALSRGGSSADRALHDIGGYVREQVELPAAAGLDPLFSWLLHTAEGALGDVRSGRRGKTGAVFGNLSFPTGAMAELYEAPVLGRSAPDPRNRFMSGLPALFLEEQLGLEAGALALDAACASSLYAIKLAIDALSEGRADLMLAGAVNRSDDLFIHVGFTALSALSKSGRSRPFEATADGLVPAEGAAFVALKRLADARRDGDRIWGVIRGVGLSNDGRGRGFLAPSTSGQARAMRAAFQGSGLTPRDISLLECHATGTAVGDAAEIASVAEVYQGHPGLPVGSLKSNLGHLITAAGVAGVIKVIQAMEAGQRPPTLHVERPNAALEGTPLRVLAQAEPWEVAGPRRAAVSAFGFGGNNAHLLLEAHDPSLPEAPIRSLPGRIAVVGLGIQAGSAADRPAYEVARATGTELRSTFDQVALVQAGLRFPPADLAQALPQQLALWSAADEAIRDRGEALPTPGAVLVGMGADPEVGRYGLRWRLPESELAAGQEPGWIKAAQDAVIPVLTSAGVVGTMPNVVANRLSSHYGLEGPGFTVSAEERSGVEALRIGSELLRRGEVPVALVGAVDLGGERPGHLDAAVALILERYEDAVAAGHKIYAVLDGDAVLRVTAGPAAASVTSIEVNHPRSPRGQAGAAEGLLRIAEEVLTVARRHVGSGQPLWSPAPARRPKITPMAGQPAEVELTAGPRPFGPEPTVALTTFAAPDRASLQAALQAGRSGGEGPCRAAVVAATPEETRKKAEQLAARIGAGGAPWPGARWAVAPLGGELGFIYAAAGAAYPGMGQRLVAEQPELLAPILERFPSAAEAYGWAFRDHTPTPLERLFGAAALGQLHTHLSRDVLGLRPQALLGYSSGESSGLFAFGVWRDLERMYADARDSRLFEARPDWVTWSLRARPEEVQAALQGESGAFLSIIHSDQDCVLSGHPEACDRVRAKLGPRQARRVNYDLWVHVPMAEQDRATWLKLHDRQTHPPTGLRIYGNAHHDAYPVSREACRLAVTDQAIHPLDLRPTILKAYADGVRVFVEHGPRAAVSTWIREILGDRPHLAVAMDDEGQGRVRWLDAVAQLWVSGVQVNLQALQAPARTAIGPTLQFPAHRGPIVLPSQPQNESTPLLAQAPSAAQSMPRAPQLPPVLDLSSSGRQQPSGPTPAASFGSTPAPSPRVVPWSAPVASSSAPVVSGSAHGGGHPSNPASGGAAGPYSNLSGPSSPGGRSPLSMAAQVHQAFLETQAQVHQHFLLERQRALGLLWRGMNGPAGGLDPRLNPGAGVLDRGPGPSDAGGHWAPGPGLSSARPTTSELPAQDNLQSELAAFEGKGALGYDGAPASSRAPSPAPAAPPSREPIVVPTPAGPGPQKVQASLHSGPPRFDREALLVHASGDISKIFGPLFKEQDAYPRQVRMPEPPLLLADRVARLDAEAGSMGKGTIVTQTDVKWGELYLHEGRMSPGLMIEAGQADLMLISYLGIDRYNRGERVYRLLGCELTYHGQAPRPGETLEYEIHVDGHAQQGDIRLFFFHYDCTVAGEKRLTVRKGQAGFFSDQELADSAGVLWSPEEQPIVQDPRLDPPAIAGAPSRYDADALRAFAEGRGADCFGPEFAYLSTHVRPPRIPTGDLLLLDRVLDFDPKGGPWGRGYLEAELDIHADDWFFAGHFKGDPCMPGTLMFDGCLQAMSFYLAACGFTVARDGHRFQVVPEHAMPLRCRGQVTPKSQKLTYQIFVEELEAGPEPTLWADVLCTVDGLKAFHARRIGLRLVPDWPMTSQPELLANHVEPEVVAKVGDFEFGYPSLLACAWGKPSDAFGEMYGVFDGTRRVARLPGPPYHFMSRVRRVEGPIGVMKPGAKVEIAYDIPKDAWYFDANGARVMPFAVLLEAALQPCGWLASYVGSALTADEDLSFRNLDGTGKLLVDLIPESGTFVTKVALTNVSKNGSTIIESFAVECFVGETKVYELNTVFGFFPKAALENQVGLPTTDEQRARLSEPSSYRLDLTERPERYCAGAPRLPDERLLMLDRITGYWPEGGDKQLGRLRAEKDVEPSEWFFKAHFFQDPVQPGSLGIEAMVQLLQFYMLEKGMADGVASPRFESLENGRPLTWKYRGQVVPKNKVISTTMDVVEVGRDARGPYAVATASLWVDGKRIYEAKNLGMRIVSDPHAGPNPSGRKSAGQLAGGSGAGAPTAHNSSVGAGTVVNAGASASPAAPAAPAVAPSQAASMVGPRRVIDPAVDVWVHDHCPTFTVPALPMTAVLERLAAIAPQPSLQLRDVRLGRWITVTRPITLTTEVAGERVVLRVDGQEVASGRFLTDPGARPAPMPPHPAPEQPSPYGTAALFHGPAFQRLRSLRRDERGASAILDASGALPGALHFVLLDAATHPIDHEGDSRVYYPAQVVRYAQWEVLPTQGEVRCEVRSGPPNVATRFHQIQLIQADRVLAELELVEAGFPKGRLGQHPPLRRRDFLQGRPCTGVSLSRAEGDATLLSAAEVAGTNWLPGTIEAVYGTTDVAKIAAQEHLARATGAHPRHLPAALPLTAFPLSVSGTTEIKVQHAAPPRLDLGPVKAFWREWFGRGPWPIEDLYYGLIERYVDKVVLADPPAFEAIRGRSVLYLANHQVAIESLLFSVLVSALQRRVTVTLAKIEHQTTWVGELIRRSFSYPEIRDPGVIEFFDRSDQGSLPEVIAGLRARLAERSLMVHIEGTRSLECRTPVQKMSGAFIDLALATGTPIVPVRFVGALPTTSLAARIERPYGAGKQSIWFGAPLFPEALAKKTYAERKALVIGAINALGPRSEDEVPAAPNPALAARIEAVAQALKTDLDRAALAQVFLDDPPSTPESSAIREALGGRPIRGADPAARWAEGLVGWLAGR